MITLKGKGDLSGTSHFLERMKEIARMGILDRYGKIGVDALRDATPKKSGKTADSWSYEIEHKNGKCSIIWKNTNINKNVNIAVILQYGHGTGTGGFVQGIDYINPAMKPVFDAIAEAAWEEVRNT